MLLKHDRIEHELIRRLELINRNVSASIHSSFNDDDEQVSDEAETRLQHEQHTKLAEQPDLVDAQLSKESFSFIYLCIFN